jgi:transposase-like protein
MVGKIKKKGSCLMILRKNGSRYTTLFKIMLVEQLLSGQSATEVGRRYNLAPTVVWRWKQDYVQGRLKVEGSRDAEINHRIFELEALVGRLLVENELLKKALGTNISAQEQNENLLENINTPLSQSQGGAI